MIRRLAALLLAILVLLPTTWAAAQAWCGMDGQPCCCDEDGAPATGASFAVEHDCCCEVAPRDEDDAPPAPPREKPAPSFDEAPVAVERLAAPVAPLLGALILPGISAIGPRGPPGALYLRHHAFLC